jgi:hypothetical protein
LQGRHSTRPGQERLPAKERQDEPPRPHRVELFLDPGRNPARRLDRHLACRRVVLAVIALDAVPAREVALQRRENRDTQVAGVVAELFEPLFERAPLGDTPVRHEPVFHQRLDRVPRLGTEELGCPLPGLQAIEQVDDIWRHAELSVSQRVHEEHAAIGQRDADVED